MKTPDDRAPNYWHLSIVLAWQKFPAGSRFEEERTIFVADVVNPKDVGMALGDIAEQIRDDLRDFIIDALPDGIRITRGFPENAK